MKKLASKLFSTLCLFAIAVSLLPLEVHAETCTSDAPFCETPNWVCQIEPGQSMGFCTPPSAAADSQPGTGTDKSQAGSGDTNANAPANTDGTPIQNTQFVPLTQLPGINDIANTDTLPAFLNNLYKLCIGAAAVLAVLQIIRGGLTYTLGDSVTEKKEARSIIVMSVVGLLLVLSPVIVFGLIDPKILNLQIDFSSLRLESGHSQGAPGTDEGVSGENQGTNNGGEAPSDNTEDEEPDGGEEAPVTGPCPPDTLDDGSGECVAVDHSVQFYGCVPRTGEGTTGETNTYVGFWFRREQVTCSQALINGGEPACAGVAVNHASRTCTDFTLDTEGSHSQCVAHLPREQSANVVVRLGCAAQRSGTDIRQTIPGPLCPGEAGAVGFHITTGSVCRDAQ